MPSTSHARRLSQIEAKQHRRVLEVSQVLSATLSEDFFRSLVEHLASALAVDCAFVAELTGGPLRRIKAVAGYRDGRFIDKLPEDLPGTASFQVLTDGTVSLSVDAIRIFPLDVLLQDVGAEGFVGLRLGDSRGQVMGLVAVINRQPLADLPLVNSVLQTFARRAAIELERKLAYETLQESEQRYRAFISSSPDAMWRIEFLSPVSLDLPEEDQIARIYRDGYVAECNQAMADLLGATNAGDLVGTLFSELISRPDDRIREELRSFVHSGYRVSTVQTMPLDAQGKQLYRLRTQSGVVENNQLLRIWGTTRDITELKRAELAVEASERRFREVLENVHLPALMLDTSGVITFCNDNLAQLIGYSKTELIGRNWQELIGRQQERETWAAILAGSGATGGRQFQSTIQPRGGGLTLIVWDPIVLRDENGEAAGVAAIGRPLGEE